jgi:PEP-CTERM motif-containing protein
VKFIYAFLLCGSFQVMLAGNIGDPTINREMTDTFSGYLYAYDGTFGANGVVDTWSIYAGSNDLQNLPVTGHQITPVLIDPNGWVITGIGATQTVSGPGLYNFDFDLVSGTAAVSPNLTFGWYDGSATSANQGTISFDRSATAVGVRDFTQPVFPTVGTSYTTFSDFTGANVPNDWTGGRVYSVQFDPPEDIPEPASYATFLGGFALLACLRRR